MIVPCECGAKLKIDDAKIEDREVRIRCPRCGNILTVSKKAEAPAPPLPVEPLPEPAPAPAQSEAPTVLIAHDSDMVRDMVGGILLDAGFRVEHASDGIEALEKAGKQVPAVMIIDVGLPGIYGFELCERLKGEPATSMIKIILLASVYGITRYKRKPTTLYGADDYIEKHHIADSLVAKIHALLHHDGGAEREPRPAVQQPAPEECKPAPEKRKPAPAPPAPAEDTEFFRPESLAMDDAERESAGQRIVAGGASGPGAHSPAGDVEISPDSFSLETSVFDKEECDIPPVEATDPEAVEKAKRFARIIVSDIALYNQDAVIEGVRKGTFSELLREDIEEGRRLYETRVPAAIRAKRDYYRETLDNFIAAQKKIVR